jgi:hypothetical protein
MGAEGIVIRKEGIAMRAKRIALIAEGIAMGTEEIALGACHFGPLPSLPWPLGHVRLISFLGLVCAALLFFSTS